MQAFAGPDSGSRGKWRVADGVEPRWRGDGRELFYESLETPPKIMAVDLEEKSGGIVVGVPHALFEVRLIPAGRNRFVVTPDGKKFLAIVPLEQKATGKLNVIVNWPSLLRK